MRPELISMLSFNRQIGVFPILFDFGTEQEYHIMQIFAEIITEKSLSATRRKSNDCQPRAGSLQGRSPGESASGPPAGIEPCGRRAVKTARFLKNPAYRCDSLRCRKSARGASEAPRAAYFYMPSDIEKQRFQAERFMEWKAFQEFFQADFPLFGKSA